MAAPIETNGSRAGTNDARPLRGRRGARASGDDRERAILETAERLLSERPLNEMSVDDLARGAGISRPTFYFYFPSKEAVVLTLIDRMVEQAEGTRDEILERLAEDPRARWREGLESFYEIFGSRRAVILAGAELRAANAEARSLWSQIMEGWVEDVTGVIEAERDRGAAPAGPHARDLAVALIQMNERVLYATFAREAPSVAEQNVVDVLLDVWLSAIYGTPTPS
jgi:TetR/AcrR family transcriptional regulator, ethionamide resistance regulator